MNQSTELQWIDYLIILICFGFVLGIDFILRRFIRSSSDFLASGRSIAAWVAGLAFRSANCHFPRCPQARLTQQYSPAVS
jgi:solute:Na+ symporter, SSS family